jgi:hypothetical protein
MKRAKYILGRWILVRDRHPVGPLGWRVITSHKSNSGSIGLSLRHQAKRFKYVAKHDFVGSKTRGNKEVQPELSHV